MEWRQSKQNVTNNFNYLTRKRGGLVAGMWMLCESTVQVADSQIKFLWLAVKSGGDMCFAYPAVERLWQEPSINL